MSTDTYAVLLVFLSGLTVAGVLLCATAAQADARALRRARLAACRELDRKDAAR